MLLAVCNNKVTRFCLTIYSQSVIMFLYLDETRSSTKTKQEPTYSTVVAKI